MKTLVLTAALCAMLSSPASAQIVEPVVAPKDDPEVRRVLTGCSATTNLGNRCVYMRPQAEKYNRLIDTRLLPLKISDAVKYFGPAVVTTPLKSFPYGASRDHQGFGYGGGLGRAANPPYPGKE